MKQPPILSKQEKQKRHKFKELLSGSCWVFTLLCSSSTWAFDLDEFIALLENSKINSAEKSVSLLPEEVLTNYTFMHTGHGLRGTDADRPSVIGFQPDGKFFVNVGSPEMEMGSEVEIMQFNEAEKRFELYRVEFPLKRTASGKIIRPEKNPQQCLSCHGANPGLLWGNYEDWKGAYGAGTRDVLYNEEVRKFQKFLRKAGRRAPYSYFHPASLAKTSLGPYRAWVSAEAVKQFNDPRMRLRQTDNKYRNPNIFAPKATGYFVLRPNTQLGILTSHMNALKIAHQIQQNPLYKKYRYLWLSVLIKKCSADQYPENLLEVLRRDLQSVGLASDLEMSPALDAKVANANKIQKALMALFSVSELDLFYLDGLNLQGFDSTKGLVASILYQEAMQVNTELQSVFKLFGWADYRRGTVPVITEMDARVKYLWGGHKNYCEKVLLYL